MDIRIECYDTHYGGWGGFLQHFIASALIKVLPCNLYSLKEIIVEFILIYPALMTEWSTTLICEL